MSMILCAVDFSETSTEALRYAIATARRADAEVHVVHAWQLPIAALADGAAVIALDTTDRVRAELEDQLRALVAAHGAPDVVIHAHLVMGEPAALVVGEAARRGCDTIVIGTHGRSGLPHMILGSVAERVVRTAPGRVIVVPRRDPSQPPFAERPLREIVCAVDFTRRSEEALRQAIPIAEAAHARVHVVHVWDPSAYFRVDDVQVRAEAHRAAQEVAAVVHRHSGRRVELVPVVRIGTAYLQIVELAREVGADLVVVGTEGKTGVTRLLLGSVAERVVRSSPVPVLTVRSG